MVQRFTSEAQGLFREWMEESQAEARSSRLPPTLESPILKMPKTADLALIFALAEGGTEAVGPLDVASFDAR